MKHGAVLENLKSLRMPWRAGPRYAPLFELGTGQRSQVALAAAIEAGGVHRLVVIKSAGAGQVDAAARARLLNEARWTARLSHPSIVQSHGMCGSRAAPALILEYLPGPSLTALLATANHAAELTLALRIAIVMRVLSGLDHAHRARDVAGGLAGVVHCAVSPDNVVITEQGQVKLIDFAAARLRPSKPARFPIRRALPYVAPESFRGDPDVRVDVFGAGAMLWELIAKEPLWGQLPTLTILRRARASNMPRLRDVVADIDPELERICRSAVAPQPDDRYPSPRAMLDDLERYLAKRGGVPSDGAIGALIRSVCREQRLEVQRTIEARLAELGLARTVPARVAPGDAARRDLPASTREAAPSDGSSPVWLSIARQRPATWAAAASSFLALLAWGAFTWGTVLGARRAREDSREPPSVASRDLVASSKGGLSRDAVLPSAAPEASAGPRLVALQVDVRPSHAVLFLDGQRLSSNPMRAAFVGDGLPHTIRAEAPGFEPLSQTLQPGAALVLDASLQPRTGQPGRAKVSPASRAPARGASLAAAPKRLGLDAARHARFEAALSTRLPSGERH
jgi:serine/threonine-protein kinase